jgi:hypothetical protein
VRSDNARSRGFYDRDPAREAPLDLRRNRSTRGLALAAALAALGVAACGSEDATSGSSGSSGFEVGPVPAGYRAVAAGVGSATPLWGADSGGTDEPFTVLSPDGTVDGPDAVIVSITGFEGYQGGLGQAARGLQGEEEAFRVEGREAIYTPAGTDDRGEQWADLVVVRGEDMAVRVTSPEATREELLDILETVDRPPDRAHAPTLTAPPGDLQVVGSLDADAVQALSPDVVANTDFVPGGASSHAVGWLTGAEGDERDQLAVLTLPGDAVDLAALPAAGRMELRPDLEWEPLEIDGRAALASSDTYRNEPERRRRSVWMESEWGDVVVVDARGRSVPSQDELVAIAASVREADAPTWDELVVEATGGPGLHADEGRTELARGTVGDLEWLLQDAPIQDSGYEPGTEPDDSRVADPCLKLSDRTRACASAGTDAGVEFVLYTTGDGLSFTVVNTTLEAASVRATTAATEATAPLVPLPDGRSWAAVIFIDAPGHHLCRPPTADGPLPTMRIDALDADGAVVGCVGFGPGSHAGGL